jgi:hypothetical protein
VGITSILFITPLAPSYLKRGILELPLGPSYPKGEILEKFTCYQK